MAEESVDIPEIAEIIKPEVVNFRRNSTGRIEMSDGRVSVPSRYLRGSIGSCHDLCKYGKKHALAEKPWRSMRIRTGKVQCYEGKDLAEMEILAERKRKSEVSLKPIPGSKTVQPDKSAAEKMDASSSIKKEIVSSKQVSPTSREIGVSVKSGSCQQPKHVQLKSSSLLTQGGAISKGNTEIRKSKEIKAVPINSLEASSSTSRGEIRNKQGTVASMRAEKKGLVPSLLSLSPKQLVKRVSFTKSKISENKKRLSPLRNQKNVQKTKLDHQSSEDVPEKILYVIESSDENRTVTPPGDGVHSSDLSPSSLDKSLKHAQSEIYTGQLPPSSPKKTMRCTKKGVHICQLPQSLPASPDAKGLRLARLGTHSTLSSLCSSPSRSSLSSRPSSKSGCRSADETDLGNHTSNSKTEKKSRANKGGIISPKHKHFPDQKLKFRRGNMVDLQPENCTPRRLKFRRRVIFDKPFFKVDTGREKLRKKEAHHGQANSNLSRSETVVLRHHIMEAKEENQKLFNKIIEQTASKLAQSRKSKVKALVGAFETVISLQDSKSSAASSRQ